MNALDIDHTKAPNFAEGSSHAPTGNIDVSDSNGFGFGNIVVKGTTQQKGALDITGPTLDIAAGTVMTLKGGNLPILQPVGRTYPQPIECARDGNDGPDPHSWKFVGTGSTYGRHWRCGFASAFSLFIPLTKMPRGADITLVHVWVDGNGAGFSHAALPAFMPSFALQKLVLDTGVVSTVGTATDTSVNLANYELYHSINLSVADGVAPVNDNTAYWLRFTPESGANAVAESLAVIACDILFTTKLLSP
jgi:hypothetical protein